MHPENDPSLKMTSSLHPVVASAEFIVRQTLAREARIYKTARFIQRVCVYSAYSPNIGVITPAYAAEELLGEYVQ